MQHCFKSEGVNANGGVCPWSEKCASNGVGNDSKEVESQENNLQDEGCESHRENCCSILSTIRRIWRKSKWNERGDTRSSECQTRTRSENTDPVQCSCPKYARSKKQKAGRNHKQVPSSDANGVRDSVYNTEVSDKPIDGPSPSSSEENHACSCFGSRSRNASGFCEKGSSSRNGCKLLGYATLSFSDVSQNALVSSLCPKTSSKDDLCRMSSSVDAVDQESQGESETPLTDPGLDDPPDGASVCPFLHASQTLANIMREVYLLSTFGCYWGPISRREAEEILVDEPDGAFLLSDGFDDHCILCLSVRFHRRTLHKRIEHSNGLITFDSQPSPEGCMSIIDLIFQCMYDLRTDLYMYSKNYSLSMPFFYPKGLTIPVSMFPRVRSLQYLCRFVIISYTEYDHIQELPLPSKLKDYVKYCSFKS